jgi:hypothetical protein
MADDIELEISLDKLCFIVALAHDYEMPDDEKGLDEGSGDETEAHPSAGDDDRGDASEDVLRKFIDELDVDEQIDLVALAWLGRGDRDVDGWHLLRSQAASAHNNRTADYLLGMPLLPDLIEEGMGAFGLSCES